jgi:hypothetical protein
MEDTVPSQAGPPPPIGGSVTKEVWPTLYRYSGTSEQLPFLPTAIAYEEDTFAVGSPPDHVSTTFPLPWSWEMEDSIVFAPSAAAAGNADVAPPIVTWNTWSLQCGWQHGANTVELVPFVPVRFEEDSWLIVPGLAPRWCWWTVNPQAQQFLGPGYDPAIPPGIYIPPTGGIKVVDLQWSVSSVDCAPSRTSVDLPTSLTVSVDLDRSIAIVDIEQQ